MFWGSVDVCHQILSWVFQFSVPDTPFPRCPSPSHQQPHRNRSPYKAHRQASVPPQNIVPPTLSLTNEAENSLNTLSNVVIAAPHYKEMWIALAQFHVSRNQAANRARPRPRPRTEKTHNTQQTCNFASMQAQLSELQKMFCQLSESVNVNKNRVEPYTGVSSSDSKLTNPKRYVETSHKKRSRRRNSLNKQLTHHTRAQNERYIKNLSSQALTKQRG